mgnify:CR=1 FL=1
MMRIKYLALLALLMLAFILPTVACGGDEKEHSYSLRDLKLVGFKDAEDITGSFNFSRSAEEKNVENLVIMRGKRRLVAAYRKNFDERMTVSTGPVR